MQRKVSVTHLRQRRDEKKNSFMEEELDIKNETSSYHVILILHFTFFYSFYVWQFLTNFEMKGGAEWNKITVLHYKTWCTTGNEILHMNQRLSKLRLIVKKDLQIRELVFKTETRNYSLESIWPLVIEFSNYFFRAHDSVSSEMRSRTSGLLLKS